MESLREGEERLKEDGEMEGGEEMKGERRDKMVSK